MPPKKVQGPPGFPRRTGPRKVRRPAQSTNSTTSKATVLALPLPGMPTRPGELPAWLTDKVTTDPASGCLRAVGLAHDKDGYARVGQTSAHRRIWTEQVGDIPPGLTIDHVRARGCRHRDCVNLAHLEPVTALENWRRGSSPARLNSLKTRCDHGHEYTPENTYTWRGHRDCRACIRRRVAEYRQRQAATRRELARAA